MEEAAVTPARATVWAPAVPWAALALRLAIASVFILASMDKIAHPDRFADVVWDYQILPLWTVNAFSVCLPWVELFLGIFLIAGVWVPGTALLAAGLTVMFIVAVSMGLTRDPANFHCGCFSTLQEGAGHGWDLVWRDALLLLGCLGLFWLSYSSAGPEGPADADGADPGASA